MGTDGFLKKGHFMTSADLSQNVDLGVDVLLDANGADPVSVRAALRSFYQAVAAAPKEKKVATVAAKWIAGEMRNRFASCAERPSVEEHRRFDALCKSFVQIGAELDVVEKDAPEYHNRAHNLLVMGTMFMREDAAVGAQGENPKPARILQSMRRLTSALGHDLAHNGKNNGEEAAYVPMLLEKASFDRMAAVFKEFQVDERDQHLIRNSLYATDFKVPGTLALFAYKHHNPEEPFIGPTEKKVQEELEKAKDPAQRKELRFFLKTLLEDQELAEEAMILKGCDMVPSYGISGKLWKLFSIQFHNESLSVTKRKVVSDSGRPMPAGQLFVMEEMVGKDSDQKARFIDPILDWLFGGHMRELQKKCRAKVNASEASQPVLPQDRTKAKTSGETLTV